MTHATARVNVLLAKLIVIGMFVQLLVIGFIVYSSHQGRVDLVRAQRAACERAKLDRVSNARGWRIAEDARRVSGDIEVSIHYANLAEDLEARSKINCVDVFPYPRIIP